MTTISHSGSARGTERRRAEQETTNSDREGTRGLMPPGSKELLLAIANLETEATGHEVRDTLLAQRLGRELADTRRLMELLALEGYLYMKRDFEPGYSSWLSPRGRTML